MRGSRRPDTLFWADASRVEGGRLALDAEESRHLLRVFRAEPGTLFDATDGSGTLYHCRLIEEHRGAAVAEILGRESNVGELQGAIHLLVGLPDSRAVEMIVEHAVPLGVASIVFAVCRRSGRDALSPTRLERLERIAVGGVKQSLRSRLPRLDSLASLSAALEAVAGGDRYVADPAGSSAMSLAVAPAPGEPIVTLAVGPPGGFDDGEAAALRHAGFGPISLGPNRLTTETAAISMAVIARKAILDIGLAPI